MDEKKRRMLGTFLNGFLLSDLKKIIGYLNDRLLIRMSKTHRKAVLISMIVNQVHGSVANNDTRILDVLVDIMNQLKPIQPFERVGNYIDIAGAGNMVRRMDPKSYTMGQAAAGPTQRVGLSSSFQYNVHYKTSPFYTVHSRLSPAKLCTSSLNTRASRYFIFEMTQDQVRYFEERDPEDGRPLYEIRFFCTGFDNQANTSPRDIEFPAICEIKVNTEHTINGTTVRGIKNKPGTANPADLTSCCHLASKRNTIEFVYAHTAKPYIGSIELVKRLPVADIVKKLKATNVISKQETLKRIQDQEADTDIVLESETISTKCPLGFCRIRTPSRSKHCQHLQCFDATTFLLMNQQTPTWSCPICNRKMESWDEVGVDEYFQDILSQVSDKVDTIRIEEGGKFKVLGVEDMDGDSDDSDEATNDGIDTNKRSLDSLKSSTIDAPPENEEETNSVTILDDDDALDPDNIPLSKRHKMNAAQPSEASPDVDNGQVIDLTLDSDDEIEPRTALADINDFFGDDDTDNSAQGNSNEESDESNVLNSLSDPTTLASTSIPLSSSTEQNGITSDRLPTAIRIVNSAIVSNDSTSPEIATTANSTLPPTAPPKNLIRLPWPPTARSRPTAVPASSSMTGTENSLSPHLGLNYSQQPTPTAHVNNIYYGSPNS